MLETIYPGETGDSILGAVVTYIGILGTFGAFAWIILFVVAFIKQIVIILSGKNSLV
jgi:hypothetical protein